MSKHKVTFSKQNAVVLKGFRVGHIADRGSLKPRWRLFKREADGVGRAVGDYRLLSEAKVAARAWEVAP